MVTHNSCYPICIGVYFSGWFAMWIHLVHPSTWKPLQVLRKSWTQKHLLRCLRWPRSIPRGILWWGWDLPRGLPFQAHSGIVWVHTDVSNRNKQIPHNSQWLQVIKKTSSMSAGMLHLGLCCSLLLVKNDQFFLIHINDPHSHVDREFYINCSPIVPLLMLGTSSFNFSEISLLSLHIFSILFHPEKGRKCLLIFLAMALSWKKALYRHFILIGLHNTDFRRLLCGHFLIQIFVQDTVNISCDWVADCY